MTAACDRHRDAALSFSSKMMRDHNRISVGSDGIAHIKACASIFKIADRLQAGNSMLITCKMLLRTCSLT